VQRCNFVIKGFYWLKNLCEHTPMILSQHQWTKFCVGHGMVGTMAHTPLGVATEKCGVTGMVRLKPQQS